MTTVVVLCCGSGEVGGAGSKAILSTACTMSSTCKSGQFLYYIIFSFDVTFIRGIPFIDYITRISQFFSPSPRYHIILYCILYVNHICKVHTLHSAIQLSVTEFYIYKLLKLKHILKCDIIKFNTPGCPLSRNNLVPRYSLFHFPPKSRYCVFSGRPQRQAWSSRAGT